MENYSFKVGDRVNPGRGPRRYGYTFDPTLNATIIEKLGKQLWLLRFNDGSQGTWLSDELVPVFRFRIKVDV